jgi:hypothetical protein
MLTWSRLDVLLEASQAKKIEEIERVNPGVFGRAGLRLWLTRNVGLHLLLGPGVYLRRQKYVYSYYGFPTAILSMQLVSFDAQLQLTAAF